MPENIAGMKWQYWAGGFVVVGGAYWLYQRRKAQQALAASSQDQTATDTTGTGFTTDTGSSAVSGTVPGSYYAFPPQAGVTPLPQTHDQWAVAAENQLVQDGFDPVTTAVALGLYLRGQTLSSDQYNIASAAIAVEGEPPAPPVPAPHVAPPPGQKPATPTLGAAPVLHVAQHQRGRATLAWSATPNEQFYTVHRDGIPVSQTRSTSLTVHFAGRYQVFAHRGTELKASNIVSWNGR